jgi:hypothetical protein
MQVYGSGGIFTNTGRVQFWWMLLVQGLSRKYNSRGMYYVSVDPSTELNVCKTVHQLAVPTRLPTMLR